MFLTGLTMMLDRQGKALTVTPYECPLELIEQLANGATYDLIICDLIMSRMNGLAFVDAIRRSHIVPVLILSGINTSPPISEMRKLGVVGFVHKSEEDAVLLEAISEALAGRCFYRVGEGEDNESAVGDFGRQVELAGDTGAVPTLSPRQMEVLQLLAGGATNAEIAIALSISENTVKTHLKVIFDAFRVTKRTSCVRAARAMGVI